MRPKNGYGDWKKLQDVMGGFDRRIQRNGQRALMRAGHVLQSMARERILGQDFVAHHPWTVPLRDKGGSKILMEQGDLLGSIQVLESGPMQVSVGVHKGAPGREGISNIALRMEFGQNQTVTEPMRRWFLRQGFPLKRTTKVLHTPARPFMLPAFEDFKDAGVAERVFTEFVRFTLEGKG